MIDLHTHTNQSDGSSSPEELLAEALRAGLQVLAITDHDTFAGYDHAATLPAASQLQLICGIELSTKLQKQTVHLLGYFLNGPSAEFRQWIQQLTSSRHDRNLRLIARLQELGLDITFDEVKARGRNMIARPHFAQVLLEKGYVSSYQEAFDKYLDKSAVAYVDRIEPPLAEAVGRIRDAGGISSLAHPIRVVGDLDQILPPLRSAGLNAIEAWHSEHTQSQAAEYSQLAQRYGLLVTGGSDYHGSVKPGIQLGMACHGEVPIPEAILFSFASTRVL